MTSDQEFIEPGSFRDPSGFIFKRDGIIYRQVNSFFTEDYNNFIKSGCYDELVKKEYLLPHEEVDIPSLHPQFLYKILKPDNIPFISYPYEWCFSQLKDAALVTLEIESISLDYDITLKDASAYNIQFLNGKPIFIDTLSFVKYREGTPWIAYKQFCQHFLAPLLLMCQRDIRLGQLQRVYIDGIPLDLASSMLPMKTRLQRHALLHIHMHANSQKKYADVSVKKIDTSKIKISRNARIGIIEDLKNAIRRLEWMPKYSEWRDYYHDNSYTGQGFNHKKELVDTYLDMVKPSSVWDLGGNIGEFSRLVSDRGIFTISFDIDSACVEINFQEVKKRNEKHLLPLLLDLTNPSSGLGWANRERKSLEERGPTDTILALALVHHLAISNNVPLEMIARYFSHLCSSLIIEFVPKSDPQVQKMLSSRKDIFKEYTIEGFEQAFDRYFSISKAEKVSDSQRIMYLMRKK